MLMVSIVTVNYNNYAGLRKTMESVFSQTVVGYEYLIIDGGSTDGSKEYIERFSGKLSYWISEHDNGIYNAMNKGISVATGNYLLFLNSGDTFFDASSLQNLVDSSEDYDIVYGNLMISGESSFSERIYPANLSFGYFLKASLPHPATLIKKELFKTTGGYFENLTIAGDWAFFLLAIVKYNCSYKHVPLIVASYDLDGMSSLEKNFKIIDEERTWVLKKYFPLFLDDYATFEVTARNLRNAQNQFGYRMYKKVKNIASKKKA